LTVADDVTGSGLNEQLAEIARAQGYGQLTPLQSAALPVLRRGGSAVLHASSGAGVTGAFGLPMLDRLLDGAAEGGGPRALILAPTRERAEALAAALARLAGGTGIAVRAALPGWQTAGADVLVSTAALAMGAVQGSTLKLEAVQTLVIVDLAEQFRLKVGGALENLMPLVPKDAQRIVTSATLDGPVEKFVDAQLRRALTIPPRPADPTQARPEEPLGQIGYIVVGEADKIEMAARLLDGVEGAAVVYARSAERAGRVQDELTRRGIAGAGGADIPVVDFEGDAGSSDRALSYDVPFGVEQLRRVHAGGGTVMVTPAELDHFKRMAREAPFTLKQRRARAFDLDELDTFRQTVRSAVESEDLTSQLLVLEPLFDEHSPAEVAAALSALLRRRAPSKGQGAGAGAGGAAAAPKDGSAGGFTRLFISIGERDNVRAGDLVGAITGEAGIKGEQVGRIDIRDTFSVVEVAISAADKVIRSLNGTTMRGRSLRVDFDRKSGGTGGAGGAGGAGGGRGGPGGGRGPGGPRGAPRGDRPRGDRPDRPDRDRPGGDRPRPGGPPRRRAPDR
jgi:ATP-dependent RNA helicase DeaD